MITTDTDGVLRVASFATENLPNTFCLGSGTGATCYGEDSDATGGGTTALGAGTIANSGSGADEASAATALGALSKASGAGSTSLGVLANASGEGSISSGMNSTASGRGALAYGFGANATAENTMAMGGFASANGDNSVAIGAGSIANGRRAIAFGAGAQALGFNTDPIAMGTNALSNGTATTSYGGEAKAIGTNATALGAYSTANGTNVIAIGANAKATGSRSVAIGAGARTTRDDQLVLGTSASSITTPSLQAGNEIKAQAINEAMAMVMSNADGTLKRTNVVSVDSQAVTINGGDKSIILNGNTVAKGRFDTEGSMRFSGMAKDGEFAGTRDQNDGEKRLLTVDGDGNAGTSLLSESELAEKFDQVSNNTKKVNNSKMRSPTPRKSKNSKKLPVALVMQPKQLVPLGQHFQAFLKCLCSPMSLVRCGIAGADMALQYAIAGGCAARINNSIHVNTAIAYTPSVDYEYGSTSSFAGRVGISFPLGGSKSSKAKTEDDQSDSASLLNNEQLLAYRTEVDQTIDQLQEGINSRDQDIQTLKIRLEELINNQDEASVGGAEANNDLIALLQKRIDELEEEKRQSALEDERQNAQIDELKEKLVQQETRFEAIMKKLQSLMPGKANSKAN